MDVTWGKFAGHADNGLPVVRVAFVRLGQPPADQTQQGPAQYVDFFLRSA